MMHLHKGFSFCLSGAALLLALLGGCKQSDPWQGKSGLRVLASFPPIYCFAANVAGEHAVVLTLLETIGVHDYQPSPRDAHKLHKADLFLINGLDLDNGFTQKLLRNANNPKLKVYEASQGIPRDRLRKMAHDHAHDHAGHDHKHGEYDPHVWLGLEEASWMVQYIGDKLAEADPAHASAYAQRTADYRARLAQLYHEGQVLFKDKKERKIVTFHDSLGYFARNFQLEVLESIQPLAGESPSPARLEKLVKLCQEQQVRVIAVEPTMMSNNAAQVLVKELRLKGIPEAEIVEFDVLESATPDQLTLDYYETRMKDNIHKLAKALK